MAGEVICTLRFEGPDFQGTLTPSAMREILGYERALEAVARDCAKADGRKRIPANLVDVGLLIRTVEPGSSVVPLERAPGAGSKQPPLFASHPHDYVQQAAELVETVLRDSEFPSSVSAASRAKVAAIGSHLSARESLVIRAAGRAEVRVDRASRKKLRQALGTTFDEERTVTGRIMAFDASKPARATATLVAQDGSAIEVTLADEQQSTFKSLLQGAEVEIAGLVRCRREGEVTRVVRVDDVTLVAPDVAPIFERLAQIAELEAGWFDEESGVFDREWTGRVAGFLERLITDAPFDVPLPGIFPHGEGDVTAEWLLDGTRIVLTFDREDVTAKAFAGGKTTMVPETHALTRPGDSLFAKLKPLFSAPTMEAP